jgi:hypothetical protein
MQYTVSGAFRQMTAVRALIAAFALTLVVAVVIVFGWALMPARATAVPPTHVPAPTSVHGEYRIPSEPVDYNDPNYLGSYGG